MDRMSSLPDEIVCHILSFLWTKEAALTTVLSKRWRNLFAFTPNLRFVEEDFVKQGFEFLGSFIDFLDRVLAVSGNSPLKKFSLKHLELGSDHTNRWIRNVLSRGVLDRLHLDIITKDAFLVPLEIFTCKTLVKLKLGRELFIDRVPENASLPALKTLFLDCILFCDDDHRCGFETLISACPVLEELAMCNVVSKKGLCVTVSCPTLQRLTTNPHFLRHVSKYNSQSVIFDTPSLAYLDYYDIVVEAYPIINLDSLVEAKLHLTLSGGPINSSLGNLIKGLRNVHILNLSTLETMETIYSFREAIPVFKNLFHLSMTTESNKCCRSLPLLLKNSPNLETLVIKGPLHYDEDGEEPDAVCECLSGYSCLLSCRVKVLELTSYGGTILELGQLKHFLEKLPCLELLKVRSWAKNKKEKLRLITHLQNLLRPSKCKKFELSFVPLIS